MAKKAENGKITKIEKPYGGSTVKERKAAMSPRSYRGGAEGSQYHS